MATGTGKTFTKMYKSLFNKEIDWDTDTIKMALVYNTSSTPVYYDDDYFDDISDEVSGTGYTSGGEIITSKTITTSDNVLTLDFENVSWTSSTFDATGAVLYLDTGTPSTSPLMTYIHFDGETLSPNDGTLTITINASGFLTVTV